MKEPAGINALSYGAIASNTALVGLLCYNTSFSKREDCIAFCIAAFGLINAISYAAQLIRIRRSYYRHQSISRGARIILHICRTFQFLYSLAAALLVTITVYGSIGTAVFMRGYESRVMAAMAMIVVSIMLNLTIFFKGWRLLKLVRKPYIDDVMSSFD